MKLESCAGCGTLGEHPMIGLARSGNKSRFEAFPVCVQCWQDPKHRKLQLKMHFFSKEQKAHALSKAGSSTIC